jgi:hypothetical protein
MPGRPSETIEFATTPTSIFKGFAILGGFDQHFHAELEDDKVGRGLVLIWAPLPPSGYGVAV